MQSLTAYLNGVKDKVQGKAKDSKTAKDLQKLAIEAYSKQEPLTIQSAGKALGIKFPNYLHQVIKHHSDKVKKVKVKGRALIVPANVS